MKAQMAMEYLLIAGLMFMVIVPTIYVFYSYSQKSAKQVNMAQLKQLGNNIVNNAETIYYMGEPSKVTIEGNMPEGVRSIFLLSNWSESINELVFDVGSGNSTNEIVFSSQVNLNYTPDKADWSPGVKRIKIEAKEDYVLINIT